MKKWLIAAIGTSFLVSACLPSFQQEDEIIQETNPEEAESQTVIIPNFQISDEYYKTLLPFETSPSRGMVVNNVHTQYDIAELENGLMRIAQGEYPPDNYFFREGKYLNSELITSWLEREYTEEQLQEYEMEPEENIGLNPIDNGGGSREERARNSPIYLAHILEHNYLTKSAEDESKVRLGGVVIGLALNSVYYYRNDNDPFGPTFEEPIAQEKIEEEGKKIAAEVIQRIRAMSQSEDSSEDMTELTDIPITVALFKQEPRSSVVPGNFFAYATAAGGSNTLEDWNNVNENHVLFPSSEANERYREDETYFLNFKQDVESYFPNFNSVIGRGFYQGDQMSILNIEIPVQFYGKAEIIGFTQYVAGRMIDIFPTYYNIEVSITSVNGPEALIIKEPDDTEPFVHIYDQ
ncbi:CamS family sex pheromone protein [Jeotgalibacillus soli]|uniref:CamS family sex pheromone protein n=1 Tax=Jeotgalibacillus soli TaxID=889306 RepID=A0A0C2VW06_9BACL|nr:CamS family sex pheromone protein [Jeotgalibacillus soli]KIL48168.1 hypothetical protein KP78_16150 [Jeotgalibacillus soli]